MAVGVIIKQREGEKGDEKDTIIKEIPELLDKKEQITRLSILQS